MLYHKEILATINLAHYFQSAFTFDQVYRYLRVKINRELFADILEDLKQQELVLEKCDALFTRELESIYRCKKQWSRKLFKRHKIYLMLISRTPWVKYLALTGANAFESCTQKDDIDLFLVTQKNRLWICYALLVVFSKLTRKRQTLCINYLIDENNLQIQQQDYYTAVQIMQMIPLMDNQCSKRLLKNNMWIFDFLPNADPEILLNGYYLIGNSKYNTNNGQHSSGFLSKLNRKIYRKYARRLNKKYPDEFGSGIVVSEGLAKLNRIDHCDIYEELYRQIYEEIKTTLTI